LAVAAVVTASLWILGGVVDIVLLAFAGLLLALLLHGSGGWVARQLHLGERLGVAAVCLIGVGIITSAMFMAAPSVAKQVDELANELPKAADNAATALERYNWGRALVERARNLDDLLERRETISRAGGALSTTLGALAGFIAFLFVGLFIAFEPSLYRRGVLRLTPLRKRRRLEQVMDEVGHTLRMWLAGKLLAMLVIGMLTWLGLILLDIPLALTLALVAATLTFVPNFGPVISAVPAVLLGFLDGPSKALYVGLLYVAIQTVESYVLTPLVQKKTVSLPPALTLLTQILMGALAGGIGVVVATPLAAAGLVLAKRLYVEDVLGDHLDDTPRDDSGAEEQPAERGHE
jgi:predicted PurR-regulated permease PerM